MAEEELIVSMSFEIPEDAEEAGVLRIGDREVRLDPSRESTRGILTVLRRVKELSLPIAVHVDADGVVDDVRLPHVGHVVRITGEGDRLDIELDTSHAIHRLRRNAPEFAPVLRRAQATGSPVILTVDDSGRVMDARLFVPDPEGPLPPLPPFPPPLEPIPSLVEKILAALRKLWWWERWPWWWWRGLSQKRAQEVFDELASLSCAPLTVPAPCIPFLYPDDGCWGRAHEMSRLLLAKGITPEKVWIRGSLHVATRNNPWCSVNWGWHVAPTVRVRRLLWTEWLVFDPSLFGGPVEKATWKGVQGDPTATLTDTSWTKFSDWILTDPTYVETNIVLARYRAALQLRSMQMGPPPYANC